MLEIGLQPRLALGAFRRDLRPLGSALRHLFEPRARRRVSWIFYYKALKMGDVATVALIDKGSVVIAILLAWWLLKEAITLQTALGALLIVAGLLVIAKK